MCYFLSLISGTSKVIIFYASESVITPYIFVGSKVSYIFSK